MDFLVAPPWCPPFVVEIDGSQHLDQGLTDQARDDLLARAGLDVVRVPVAEVRVGDGVKSAKNSR